MSKKAFELVKINREVAADEAAITAPQAILDRTEILHNWRKIAFGRGKDFRLNLGNLIF